MFSTLLGWLPPNGDPGGDPDEVIRDNVADLEATGLELLSTGLPPARPDTDPAVIVAAWETAAAATTHPVKQALLGPYSATRDASPAATRAAAARVNALVGALVEAGCPFVEIAEPDALPIAVIPAERRRFVDAHQRIAAAGATTHVSLAMTGGSFETAGAETFFELAYASVAFDLIAGPDNWRLIAVAPQERGIVCAALDVAPGGDETRELLVWAAHYAASTRGRGLDRVGLANASSLDHLARDVALRKLRVVAEAARIAAVESAGEMASLLDARAFGGRRDRPGGAIRLARPDDD